MSLSTILLTSVLTGVFCAGFATVVDLLTEALNMTQLLLVSFVSGFSGSLVAQFVTRRKLLNSSSAQERDA
jgi:hypothetical protein